MNKITLTLVVISLCLGGYIGYSVAPTKVVKEPQIKNDTTYVYREVRDTTRILVKRPQITVRDTLVMLQEYGDSIPVNTTCMTVDTVAPDGASIQTSICSKELPKIKPLDLIGKVRYVPPPSKIQVIHRIDSLKIPTPLEWYRDWKTYALIFTTGITIAAISR